MTSCLIAAPRRCTRSFPRQVLALSAIAALSLTAVVPAHAARATPAARAEPTPVEALKPGQFLWHPEFSPDGPVTIVVSLDEQRAYVYRNGISIGVSTVSTGKPGKDTPTGVFTILQKKVTHSSSLYNSAPMPYMQRLTWDGIAMHAGNLPGYPASHGCIRLPMDFARALFSVTGFQSTTVIIANTRSAPSNIGSPGWLAPTVVDGKPVAPNEGREFWNDPDPASGTLSLLVSRADQRLYAYRNGQQVGEAVVGFDDSTGSGNTSVFTLLNQPTPGMSLGEAAQALRWSTVSVGAPARGDTPAAVLGTVHVPEALASRILSTLGTGSTLIVTDWPASRDSGRGQDMTVITTDEVEENPAAATPVPTR